MHSIWWLGTSSACWFHCTAWCQFEGARLSWYTAAFAIGLGTKDFTFGFMDWTPRPKHCLAFQTVRLVIQPLRHAFVAALVALHLDAIIWHSCWCSCCYCHCFLLSCSDGNVELRRHSKAEVSQSDLLKRNASLTSRKPAFLKARYNTILMLSLSLSIYFVSTFICWSARS